MGERRGAALLFTKLQIALERAICNYDLRVE